MGTIIEFIESESFFPLLILLFVALLCIFTSILMSSRKKKNQRVTERKNVKIDESAQVQLVSEHGRINQFGTMEEDETLEIETGGSEVNLFIESVDINELEQSALEENDSTIYDFEPIFPINKEKFSEEEVEVTPYMEDEEESVSITDVYEDETQEMDSTDEEEATPDVEKEENISIAEVHEDDQEINPSEEDVQEDDQEIDSSEETISDETDEVKTKGEDEIQETNEEPTIEEDIPREKTYEEENNNAFTIKPDDNKEINEDIIVEKHEEYSNKTEILDFPDFDSINQDTEIENDIINEANKYIESIMNR